MMRKSIGLCILTGIAVLTCFPGCGDAPDENITITLQTVDSNSLPIPGLQIGFFDTRKTETYSKTDSNGMFKKRINSSVYSPYGISISDIDISSNKGYFQNELIEDIEFEDTNIVFKMRYMPK